MSWATVEVDGIPLSVGVIGITPPGIMTWHRDALEGRVDTIPAIDAIAVEKSAENFNQIDPDETAPQELVNGIEPFDFDIIDGVEYHIDVTQPLGERIVNATFEGEPLTAEMEFAVVTNDYRAGGGGGFPHLDGTHTIVSSDMANRAILVEYFLEESPITEPQDHNWSILPVEVAGQMYFRTSPDAEEYANAHGVSSVEFLEIDDDGWGIFEYLFEVVTAPPDEPQTKDDCRNGGWQDYGFKNQGRCIAHVASDGKANPPGPRR